jgi:DNA-binding MarR family transcriptional regulator
VLNKLLAALLKATSVETTSSITSRQLLILLNINSADPKQPISVGDVAGALEISKPAVTRGIDALAEWGLVDRQDSAKDRRLVVLKLTAAGKSFLANIGKAMEKAA